jgi:hypothetical protein
VTSRVLQRRDLEVDGIWITLTSAVVLVWLATRVSALRLGLWWDEAFTAQRYVRDAPATLLDPDAYVANNHVLFSALTWASSRVTGTSDPALRLWAIVPAALATILLVRWVWQRIGPAAGLLALTLTVTSTLWLTMSTQARGYGLVILASSILVIVVVTEDRRPTWRGDVLVAASGWVAMATFPPTVALYLVHTGVWLVRRRTARLRLVVLTSASGLLTAVLYLPLAPMLFERADRVGSRFADPITWWSPILAPLQIAGGPSFGVGTALGPVSAAGITTQVGTRTVELGLGSLPGLTAMVLGLLGLAVLVRRDQPLAVHLLAGLGGAIALLGPVGFHLADRYLAFLLPHATIAVAVGLVVVADGVAVRLGTSDRAPVAVIVVILTAATLPVVWQASTTPVQAFADAAAFIRDRPDAVVVVDRYHTGYRWYLDDLPVERVPDQATLESLLCEPDGRVVFARHPDTPVLDVPACLTASDEHRFPHQRVPGHLSLWVVGDAGD